MYLTPGVSGLSAQMVDHQGKRNDDDCHVRDERQQERIVRIGVERGKYAEVWATMFGASWVISDGVRSAKPMKSVSQRQGRYG